MAIPTPMSKVIPVNLDFKSSSISNWKPFNTGMGFWTNDIGTAFLEFSTELDLTGTVASIVLENQYDKSLVQKTITEITSSPFYYQLGDEIQHEGRWFVQISVKKGEETIVSNSFAFMVNASIGHGKVARLVSIETFETLATQLTALQTDISNYLETAETNEAIRVSTYDEIVLVEETRKEAEDIREANDISRGATATADNTRANTDHSTAVLDHSTALTDHSTSTTDHATALADHSIASSDHSTAVTDHTRANTDHTTALADHTSYEGLLTDGVLATNIENKLLYLETTYAPELNSVKQQLADIVQVNVKSFGAKGDGVTDDTDAINDAIVYVKSLTGKPTLFFPNSFGYIVNTTIVIPINVNVKMMSNLIYNGYNDKPCLIVGESTVANSNVDLILSVGNKNQSDWGDENSIGIKLLNTRNSFVKIIESSGFTIGLQCMASANGFAWNNITLGRFLNNKYSVDVTNEKLNASVGWANENLFLGGSFVNQGSVNVTHDRYGVRVTSKTSDYYNNSNHFIKPDFELSSVSGKLSIPVLIEYGGHSTFDKCRKESLQNSIFAIIKNNSDANRFDLSYSDTICSLQDESSLPTNSLTQLSENIKYQSKRVIFASGNLLEKACYYDVSGKVNITNCHFGDIYNTGSWKASSGIVLNSDGIQVSTAFFGIYINTQQLKKFVIAPNIINGSTGRLYIVCYDAAGNQTTADGVLKSKSTNRFGVVASFGGSFKTNSNMSDEVIVVSDAVKKIRILFGSSGSPLQMTGFSVYSLDFGSAETMLGYDYSPNNYAVAIPVSGTWEKGKKLINDNVSELGTIGSKYIIEGWICITAGTPGTWVQCRMLTGN